MAVNAAPPGEAPAGLLAGRWVPWLVIGPPTTELHRSAPRRDDRCGTFGRSFSAWI
jgi:hypothetical protein